VDFPARKYGPCHLRHGKNVNTKLLEEQFADFRFALRVHVNSDRTFGCWQSADMIVSLSFRATSFFVIKETRVRVQQIIVKGSAMLWPHCQEEN